MTVAVTGGSGHIGVNLIRTLLQQRREVRVLIHNENRPGLDGLDIQRIHGDIRDPYSLVKLVSGVDVVYHLAASISLSSRNWKEVEAVNVTGTRNVVDACQKCNVGKLIHFSSIHALVQEPFDIPVDERRPLVDMQRCPPYDRSKAAGELEIRAGVEQGLDAVILNPTGVVGPHDYEPSYFGAALLAMAQGKLPALIEGGFNWVDVRDVAAAALQAEAHGHQGARYLLSGNYATIRELAELIYELVGTPVPRWVAPAWLVLSGSPALAVFNRLTGGRQLLNASSLRALSTCNREISHERATRELDYHPRPLRETLRDTFNWFQSNGQLKKSPGKTKTTNRGR